MTHVLRSYIREGALVCRVSLGIGRYSRMDGEATCLQPHVERSEAWWYPQKGSASERCSFDC